MCSALEELEKKAEQKGEQRGLREGIQEGMIAGMIKTCKKFKFDQEATVKNVMEEFSLSKEEAEKYIKLYW